MSRERPKVALIGARGIPAEAGGGETFADELSQKLTKMGFDIYVTCNSHRFYQDKYEDVIRIHSPSVQGKTLTIPTVNEIIHTFHVLVRCPKIKIIFYILPYGAILAPIPKLLGKKVIIGTDGLEWKKPLIRRTYFSLGWSVIAVITSWHLKTMEWLSIKLAHVVIADSMAIKSYLDKAYKPKNVEYISYGARDLLNSDISAQEEYGILRGYGLSTEEYYLTVARIVAENNIHIEMGGFCKSKSNKKLVIIGNFNSKDGYTRYLTQLRDDKANIIFLDPIYEKTKLGVLRKNCFGYIHAYQAGGTNPSLLEQMIFKKPILASDIDFHREVLQNGGIYFKDEDSLARCIGMLERGEVDRKSMAAWQVKRIEEEYNWDYVADRYAALFGRLLGREMAGATGK